jgi:uncharacterized repeat protein (TIGR01451 family)
MRLWTYRFTLGLLAAIASGTGSYAQTGPGYALSFNGSNQYISVPSSAPLNLGSQWTIELWIFQTSALPANGYRLVDKETGGTQDGYLLDTYDGVTGRKLRMAFGGAAWSSSTTYNLNTWHHVAVTYNGGTLSFYLDGVADGVVSGVPAPVSNSLDFRIGAPHVGCSGTCGLVEYFHGTIDEVRVWNVARSQAQIQGNMNRSLVAPQSNLVAYWRLDEGTGTNAFDSSGSGLTSVLVNGPAWITSTFPFVPAAVTLPAGTNTNGLVTLNGSVNPNGLQTAAWFQWGTSTNYGSNTVATGVGAGFTNVLVQATLSNLLAGNPYHFSLLASNSAGSTSGADQVLIVPPVTLEYVPGKFGVINMIPNELSGEYDRNSEPSFCYGVNGNYFEVVAHTFGFPLNPYFGSSSFGTRWFHAGTVYNDDATMDWSSGGTCYMAMIPFPMQMSVLESSDPVGGVPFSPISSSTITRGSVVDQNRNVPDQPRVKVVNVNNVDHIFVGFNDRSVIPGKTATIRYSIDGGSTWKETVIEKITPGQGLDSSAVPIAVSGDGKTVYALFQRWNGTNGDDFLGDVVLVRDDNYGDGGFGALGNGTLVAHDVVLPGGTPLGFMKLGNDCDVAINPDDPSQVYVAYTTVVSGEPTYVHILRSRDSGAHFSLVSEFYGAKPALAVAKDGTVGILSAFVGWNLTDFEFAFTKYLGGSFASEDRRTQILAKFPITGEFLGDYFGLRSLNYNFYGVFSAPGDPIVEHFPSGVYYQRNVLTNGTIAQNFVLTQSGTLADTTGQPTSSSIDPFFFYDIAPYFREVHQLSMVAPSVKNATDPLSGFAHLSWPVMPDPVPQFSLLSARSLGSGTNWHAATNSTILNTNGEFVATFLGSQPQQFYRLQQPLTNTQFPLLALCGSHGTLAPSGLLTNPPFATQTFLATPSNNYFVSQWFLDGILVQSNRSSLTLSNINSEHTLLATFVASNDLAVTVFEKADEGPTLTSSTNEYVVNIENKGLNILTGIVMTNRLPASASFISASSSTGSVSYSSGNVSAFIASLAPGQGVGVQIMFIPVIAGTLTNTVNVTCDQQEPDLSNNAATNVTPVIDAVTITNQPTSQNVASGSSATFSVSVSGTPPFTYEWLFNGTNLLSVSTNSSLTLTNVAAAQAGSYSVSVFQIVGPEQIVGLTSSNALLSVH